MATAAFLLERFPLGVVGESVQPSSPARVAVRGSPAALGDTMASSCPAPFAGQSSSSSDARYSGAARAGSECAMKERVVRAQCLRPDVRARGKLGHSEGRTSPRAQARPPHLQLAASSFALLKDTTADLTTPNPHPHPPPCLRRRSPR
jgi:hypothetical protein